MSAKNPVMKVNLHKANSDVSNEQRTALSGGEQADKMAALAIKKIESRQEEIDAYNKACNDIDPAFQDIQLAGKTIVVKLHKENYIKSVSYYADGVPLYDAWISQVDGRMHQSDRPNWIDNPLPYVFTGVVVAMSPQAKADAAKEANDSGAKVLEVGDIISLEHFMFADKRFYLDKQARDFLKNPNEYRIVHWEGYVRIHPSMIESIILNKEKFLLNTSPYAKHLANKNSEENNQLNAETNA